MKKPGSNRAPEGGHQLIVFPQSKAKPIVGAAGKGTGRCLKEVSRCGLLVQEGCEETGEAWTRNINMLMGLAHIAPGGRGRAGLGGGF